MQRLGMEGQDKDKSEDSGGAGREVAGAENKPREPGREIRVSCFCSGIYRGLHVYLFIYLYNINLI